MDKEQMIDVMVKATGLKKTAFTYLSDEQFKKVAKAFNPVDWKNMEVSKK